VLLGLRQVKLRRFGIFFPCYYYCSDHHEALRSAHSRLARWNHRGRSLLHVPVLFSPSADLVYSHEPFFIISLILLLCMFISLLGWQGLVYTSLVSILEKLDKVVVISVRFLLCDSGGLFLLFSPRRKLPNSAHVSRGGKTWGHVYQTDCQFTASGTWSLESSLFLVLLPILGKLSPTGRVKTAEAEDPKVHVPNKIWPSDQ
jgi:hypothetical protein